MGHWLADPDKLGQAVHFGGFAPTFCFVVSRQRMLPQMEHSV